MNIAIMIAIVFAFFIFHIIVNVSLEKYKDKKCRKNWYITNPLMCEEYCECKYPNYDNLTEEQKNDPYEILNHNKKFAIQHNCINRCKHLLYKRFIKIV